MPITKEQEEKLREEWFRCWKGGEMPAIMEKCAEWWLSKMNEALTAQRKEIVEAIKNRFPSDFEMYTRIGTERIPMNDAGKSGLRTGVDAILSLPQLQVNEEQK